MKQIKKANFPSTVHTTVTCYTHPNFNCFLFLPAVPCLTSHCDTSHLCLQEITEQN